MQFTNSPPTPGPARQEGFHVQVSTIYNYRITVLAMRIMRISVAAKGLSSAGMMLEIV